MALGARIRIAASHIKGEPLLKALMRLARRAASLEVLAEPTLRRVPMEVERKLKRAGIPFRRVAHPEGLPMHNKFVLAERDDKRWVVFGSFNWTTRSYWLNYEIVAISNNKRLYGAFADRWDALRAQTEGQAPR
jgi:phosphatidylserine/phosphatidylglycerophosphate/cardiolipin synthase-like enzyme